MHSAKRFALAASIVALSLLAPAVSSVKAAQVPNSIETAIDTFNAAAADPAKVAALCSMMKDLAKVAGGETDSNNPAATEATVGAAMAKLPADLKSAVDAEFDLAEDERGDASHPYYQAMEKMASQCPPGR